MSLPSLAVATAEAPQAPARLSWLSVRLASLAGLCAVTLVAPALLLVWLPILLGVPHVASDLRYLVAPLPRAQAIVAVAASVALVTLEAASIATATSLLRAEMVVVACWLVAAVAMSSGAAPRRRAIAIGSALLAAAVIVGVPLAFAALAAFAHNAVAIVAWVVVARPGRRRIAAVGAAIALAIAVLAIAGPAIAAATGGDETRWLSIDRAAALLFGGVPLEISRGLVIAFAFLQGVHYAIWLDWIPASQPRPRRARVTIGLLATGAAALAVIAAAAVDPAWARTTYLALASFHIYLELVVLAARWARGRA